MRRTWSMLVARLAFAFGVLAFIAGCGGQYGVLISPSIPLPLTAGQSLSLYAASKDGVTWTVTGGGTLSDATSMSVLYTAPAVVTTSFKAVVTATSISNSSLIASVNIPVNGNFAITTTALAGGQVGAAYSATLTAGGGTAPLAWTVASGALPGGLTLDASSGIIAGTPSAAGIFPFTVQAKDANGLIATQALSITIAAAPVVTTTVLPNGTVGTSYSQQLTYSGGVAGMATWAISSGSLTGSGLTLSSAGLLSGTVASPPATYSFSVTVTVGTVTSAPQALTLTTVAFVPPAVTTIALPNGISGTGYSQQLTDTPGSATGTTTWAISSGSLTGSGLTLSSAGVISGTAATAAIYSFSVTVTIGTAVSAPQALTLTVLPAVITSTLPGGTASASYSQTLAYSGGGTPTWAISSGSLTGSGLTLSSAGVISGTATSATATYSFSVTVTVGTLTSAAQALTLTIAGPSPVITSSAALTGEVNLPFSYPLQAIGGTPPYTWSVASGALPAGVTLNTSTGVLSGAPTTAAGSPFAVTIQATDSASSSGTKAFTITVNAARSSVNNGELLGQYAFLLNGFDAGGNPLAVAGKFTADGAGNISSGVVDLNGTGLSAASNLALSAATYAVGSDNRGRLTLTSSAGSMTFVVALSSITAGVANSGYVTEFDASGQSLTGILALQDTTAFTTASLTGGYAFGLSGNTLTAGQHAGAVGELQLDGAGGLTSGETILSSSGSTPIPLSSAAYTVGTNGRGTLALTLPGGGGTVNMAFYVVSAKQVFLISIDPASGASAESLLTGQALAQTVANGDFTLSSLSGIAVFRTQAIGSRTAGAATTYYPDAQVGLYTFSGSGASSGTISVSSDENAGGTAASDSASGTYTVSANGRVVGAVAPAAAPGTIGGCTDCATVLFYSYLVGANEGFTMDLSTGVNTGYFEAQTATGFTPASLDGTYALGTIQPLVQNTVYGDGVIASTGTGSLSGTQDQNSGGTLLPDEALSGTYTVDATGRGTAAVGSGSAPVFYIISPTKGLLIDTASANPVIQEVVH